MTKPDQKTVEQKMAQQRAAMSTARERNSEDRIASPIVGSKFHKGAREMLDRLPDDIELRVARQPENPHDKNAIAVFHGFQQLGFVTAEIAKTLAPLMDIAGRDTIPGRYDKGDGRNPTVSMKVLK